jgi:hypothetical protein
MSGRPEPCPEEVMKEVLYDAVLKEKLSDLDEPIELCDEEGRVLARILPRPDPARDILEPQISKEELMRRKAEPGRLDTTAEVLADLESLGCSGWPGTRERSTT